MHKHFPHLLLATILACALILAAPTGAQTLPLPTDTPTPETTENLRERIEKIVEEQKEKVQSLLGQTESTRQGFIGQVTRVSEETLTVESRGTTRIVPLDGVELLLGNSAVKPETIEVGSWALVMGLKRNESFIPKKIIFSRTSLRPEPRVVYLATIKAIDTNSVDFQPRGQEATLTASIVRATKLQDNSGAAARLADFAEDDQVLLVGYQDEETLITTAIRALAPADRNQ